jgi:hypothetical protein
MTFRHLASASLLVLLAGCAYSATLHLEMRPVVDRTIPEVSPQRVSSVMVVPPQGQNGDFPGAVDIERALLASGVKVISPAVTGRVVQDESGTRPEPAQTLSYVEKALLLARQTNAEAILQLIEARWEDHYRTFVNEDGTYGEVQRDETADTLDPAKVTEERFVLKARLIDVNDGSVLLSVDLSQGTSNVGDFTLNVPLDRTRQGHEISTSSPQNKQAVMELIARALVSKLRDAPPSAVSSPTASAATEPVPPPAMSADPRED